LTKKSWLARLDHYWFAHGSPTTMGLFRAIMSSLVFINLAMIVVDWRAWFSENGFVPEATGKLYQGNIPLNGRILWFPYDLQASIPRLNILSGVTNDWLSLSIYIGIMMVTLLCALGLWTRVTSILMAIGIVSIHHRNGLILHGGDTVLRVSALYIAIAPSGAACSLDRLFGLWKGKIAPGPVRVSLWPQRLLAYNTALIYFTTFWHKYGFGSHWRDMTATWYPARLHEFDRFPVPPFMNNLPMVYVSTFFTLATELAMGTLVFYKPLRKWVLLAGVGLHAFIDYSMNIPLFSWLMVSLYISFYEGTEVEAWAKQWGTRLAKYKVLIRLPQRMALKPGAAAALEAVDPLGLVDYADGDSPAWEASANGRAVKPFRASLSRSVGAWPLAVVPYLWNRLLNSSLETASDSEARTTRPSKKSKVTS
jgi:hypothetical protein